MQKVSDLTFSFGWYEERGEAMTSLPPTTLVSGLPFKLSAHFQRAYIIPHDLSPAYPLGSELSYSLVCVVVW